MFTEIENVTSNERGFVMVVSLVLLLVLTIVGVMGVTSSTVENMRSGNIRVRTVHLSEADGGIQVSIPLIVQLLGQKNNYGFEGFTSIDTAALLSELKLSSFNPDCRDDLEFDGSSGDIGVDIDKMYAARNAGCLAEFASEAETSGRCHNIFYRINSTSAGGIGEEATVGTVYKYVPF